MWIFTKLGFLSVVEDRDHADKLAILARFREDIDELCQRIAKMTGDKEVVWQATQDQDYPYGVTCGRETMASLVEQLVREIDSTQFRQSMHDNPMRERDYLT